MNNSITQKAGYNTRNNETRQKMTKKVTKKRGMKERKWYFR